MKKKLSKILISGIIFGILAGAVLYVQGPLDPPPMLIQLYKGYKN